MEHVNQATTTHLTARSRYTGPTAARIAELLAPHGRVRFERGWFWTGAVCHDSEQDLMAFRQRPDGDGIDVRCKSAGCSRERMIRSLEQLTGESIWSAYATARRGSTPTESPADYSVETAQAGRRSWLGALAPLVALLLAAPLVFGHGFEVAALNTVGVAWVGWLARRALVGRRRAASNGGRPR